jgi:hypothetical protein
MVKYIAVILLTLSAIGCDPVRRVLDDPAYRTRASDELLRDGLCRYDTLVVVKTDTIIRTDTIGEIVIFTDTTIERDTVRITATKWREIVRTVTIRDTLRMTVVDVSGRDANMKHVAELEGRLKEVGDSAKRYRMATGFLLIALVGLIALAVRK